MGLGVLKRLANQLAISQLQDFLVDFGTGALRLENGHDVAVKKRFFLDQSMGKLVELRATLQQELFDIAEAVLPAHSKHRNSRGCLDATVSTHSLLIVTIN